MARAHTRGDCHPCIGEPWPVGPRAVRDPEARIELPREAPPFLLSLAAGAGQVRPAAQAETITITMLAITEQPGVQHF